MLDQNVGFEELTPGAAQAIVGGYDVEYAVMLALSAAGPALAGCGDHFVRHVDRSSPDLM